MNNFTYDVSKIDRIIKAYLPEVKGYQKTVYKAMNEAVINGGKRVRPILIFETGLMFAKKNGIDQELFIKEASPFMAAMEMMHTSSLIHDDLPCMDNDVLRRGQPTTWVSFGEPMAVLAGDALMVESLKTAAMAVTKSSNIENSARALQVLAYKSGMQGMIGGQVVDVENTGKVFGKGELDFIYRLKTSALLEASMMIGAILAGADKREISLVEKIATDIGLSFQIKDDILDEISTSEELGKPIHSDEKNLKTTYVTIYGLEAANNEATRLTKEARELLDSIDGDKTILNSIIGWLIDRKK